MSLGLIASAYEITTSDFESDSDTEDPSPLNSTLSGESLQTATKPSEFGNNAPIPTSNPIRRTTQDQANPYQNSKKPKGFKCPYCFDIFADSNTLILHLQTHETPFDPSGAAYAIPPIRETIRNIDSPNAISSKKKMLGKRKKVACPICKCLLFTNSSYHRHMQQHSQAGRPLPCSICSCFFRRQTDLLRHKNEQHGRKPGSTLLTCTICKKCFLGEFRLNRHIRVHTQEQPFECTVCPQKYSQKSHLDRHIKGKHGHKFTPNTESFVAKIRDRNDVQAITLKCPHCPCFFARETDLHRHENLYHGRMSGKTKFTCKICMKTFLGGFKLIRHMHVHNGEKPFVCPVCPRRFQKTSHLIQHLKEVHGSDCSSTSKIAKYFSLEYGHGLPSRLSNELRPCQVILVRYDAKLFSSSEDKSN